MPSFANPNRGPGGARYPGTFMLALREAFAKLNWQAVTWKGTHVECLDADGKTQQVGFENLYRRLRREERGSWPDQIAQLIGSVPAEHAEPPTSLAEVADRLLVRLSQPIKSDNPDIDIWSHTLVAHQIVATLVIDYPSSMSYVSAKMVADSGEAGATWLKRGLANLLGKSNAEAMAVVHPESGLMQGHFADAYDSSRALLLDELLPGHEEFGFYVIVPSRDHVLVLPISAQTVSLAPWLRAIAGKTYQEMPYAISPELYWVRRGIWYHFAIELKGDDLTVNPPPEFAEVLDGLQPDRADDDADADDDDKSADSPRDDSGPLPI